MRRLPGLSRHAALHVSAAAFMLAAPSAFSQEATTPEPASSDAEPTMEVTVTGSRIARPETAFANPVVSISADAIQRSGSTNITELLSSSPALVGSVTGNRTGGSETNFGETGLNLLDLRNLGSDRTLVLVDGRRHVAAEAGSAAVDVDAIPTDLIEAVDVLTGGASAIYGADGVSGVVNFRMKRDFEGISARVQTGTSRHGDGDNRFASITAGRNFGEGRGNIAFAVEYNADDRLPDQARAFLRDPKTGDLFRNQGDLDDDPNVPDNIPYRDVRYADSSRAGGVDVDFDYLSDFEGNGAAYDRGFVLEGSGGYTVGGSSTPISIYQGDLFPRMRRTLVNGLAHFDFSDAFSLYGEAKYVHAEAFSYSQPTFEFRELLFTTDNPFMPDSIRNAVVPGAAAAYFGDPDTPDGVLMLRDNFDLGINGEDIDRDTLRGVVGATGRLTDHAKYDISYVYGETRSRIVSVNNRITANWAAATDVVSDPVTGQPVCRSSLDPDAPASLAGCVPYNVFGEHVQDPAAIDFILTDSVSHARLTQQVLSASISGDLGSFLKLPGGSLGYAVGAEYRRETSDFVPDPLIQQSLTWVEGEQPKKGKFDVKEVFLELNAPVLEDRPLAKLLSFGGAVRLSDYETVGKTTTWKVDTVYAPTRSVSLRGTYSQAVRAPNIAELFNPPSYLSNFIVDPCDTQELNNGSASREANCAQLLTALGIDPATFSPSSSPQASIFTDGLAGGNPDLSEETAKTWTAGIVLRPGFLPSLTITADWYDIDIKKAINTPEAQELADLCVDQPTLENPYCVGITRSGTSGFITGFNVRPQNVASFTTSGLDVTANYQLPATALGNFNVRLLGGYLHELKFVASPGAAATSEKGQQYMPRYVATLDLYWEKGPMSVTYSIDWFNKTNRYANDILAGDPDYVARQYRYVKAKWEHDVQLDYEFTEKFSAYVGVNNLFDQKPEFGSTSVDTLSSYPVSAMGQFLYVGAKASF